jgi:hypothetical protein
MKSTVTNQEEVEMSTQIALGSSSAAPRRRGRSDASALNSPKGLVAYQFHARDVNLVMGPARKGATVRFRVLLDGESAGPAHGADVDANGNGTVAQPRMYQLIRQPRTDPRPPFEIEFLDGGAEAFCFTFG